MKLAVGGKGGAGKTTIAGTLARVFAERGQRVVAIDDDSNPNLALTVGVDRGAAFHCVCRQRVNFLVNAGVDVEPGQL